MVAGRVEATGTVRDIIGDATAVQVDTEAWEQAFNALTAAGMTVLLAGRSVRVPSTPAADVRQALDAAGISARLDEVPSTLDETLITLIQTASDGV